MEVEIKSCLEGARKAEGIAVIIDVLRASNTIIALLGQGVKGVIPVSKLKDAYELKRLHPSHLLVGERKGIPPEGFDYGNSPVEVASMNLQGKTAIITTSAGSQGIVNAKNSKTILIGSFANASALSKYIISQKPGKVSLVAIGYDASEKAQEDELCADYLRKDLLGGTPDFDEMRKAILSSKRADRMRRLGQGRDLEFALRLDINSIIPVFDKQAGMITRV